MLSPLLRSLSNLHIFIETMLPNNNTNQSTTQSSGAETGAATLRPTDIVIILVSHWPWILLCILLGWGIAETIIRTSRPIYTRNASILIKDMNKGNSLVDSYGFGDAGLFAQATDLNNEIFMLRSPASLTEVIKRLNLQMNYEMEGMFHRATLYGNSLPFTVSLNELSDLDECSFSVVYKSDNSVLLSSFTKNGIEQSEGSIVCQLDNEINTPVGKVIVSATPAWYAFERKIWVNKVRLQSALATYSDELKVASENGSTIINLTVNDFSIQRAEEILYSLISIYNEQWMQDRNQISVSTNQFINERLQVIEGELGNVDSNISDYKSEHLIAGNAESVAGMYINQAHSASTQIVELNNQLYMARSVRGYLTNESNYTQLLPSSQALGNTGISSQIQQYNNALLRRNSLVSASSLENPIVKDLDNQLASLRQTLISSIDTHINELNVLVKSAQGVQASSNSRVAASPSQNKYLLSVERQQKVKESLYLFLLQKREENELSQAFTAYNNRVVTPPSGVNEPTSPVSRNIYLVCLAIGLAVPVAFLLLRELANTSVRGRKDLDVLNIPFLGELPLNDPGSKLYRTIQSLRRRFQKDKKHHRHHEDKTLHLLVKKDSTNAMNEAFRVVRTNMEFIAGRGDGARVCMLTSFNPNSGKTFVVSNLAMALTFKKKRVLTIDLDMRKRSLSALVGKHSAGLSNYLGGYIDDYHEVIKEVENVPGLHVLPAGKIPPNPTELLYEQRLDDLVASVRKEYDYVFIDCPPLEIVADATIAARLADMSIFVIRAEALQLTALPDVQKYYDENRLPKMTILLNGTTDAFSRYGYHRYGSRYGYAYGYGRSYSYGYGYGKDEDASENEAK